jgi:hypothetical protein
VAVAAPVGGLAVGPRRFHPPPAHAAGQQPGQEPRPGRLLPGRPGTSSGARAPGAVLDWRGAGGFRSGTSRTAG